MTSRERAHQAAKILAGAKNVRLRKIAERLMRFEARMIHETTKKRLKLITEVA